MTDPSSCDVVETICMPYAIEYAIAMYRCDRSSQSVNGNIKMGGSVSTGIKTLKYREKFLLDSTI